MAHPAIVQLYDFFKPGEELALVLEYVDGLSLARLVSVPVASRGRSGWRSRVAICYVAVARASRRWPPRIRRAIRSPAR